MHRRGTWARPLASRLTRIRGTRAHRNTDLGLRQRDSQACVAWRGTPRTLTTTSNSPRADMPSIRFDSLRRSGHLFDVANGCCLGPAFLDFCEDSVRDRATGAVFHMLRVPLDTLIHGGTFWHQMRFVPIGVQFRRVRHDVAVKLGSGRIIVNPDAFEARAALVRVRGEQGNGSPCHGFGRLGGARLQ